MKNHMIMESKLHGHSTSYSSKDFKITEHGNYKKGLKDGNWVYYSTNGSQEKMQVYEYGDLIKTLTK
jgi:antitoxin component YwqK of YwqJK toxin-antitoxin module